MIFFRIVNKRPHVLCCAQSKQWWISVNKWHVQMWQTHLLEMAKGTETVNILENIFKGNLIREYMMERKPKKRIKILKRRDWFGCKSGFWMLKNSYLYELQNILIYWEFCVRVYCRFFIVLFCKLTFIRLASHMNNFPVSACCLLDQIIGILMTILKVQVLVLDWAVPAASRHWICVRAFLISDSNSDHKSKFWIERIMNRTALYRLITN